MKYLFIIFSITLLSGCASTEETTKNENSEWPVTVEEAVHVLMSEWLSNENIDWIRLNPKENVVANLHLPFGTSVRNAFGLWGQNMDLLRSCGHTHAEACSSAIFEALWETIRSETDPELIEAVNCQISLLDKITINPAGFSKWQIGDVLNSLQDQISSQLHAIPNSCATELTIEVVGDPNLACWTRYEFNDPVTLNRFLGLFPWRNGAAAKHNPPRIELRFNKQCSWPEMPEYFQPR